MQDSGEKLYILVEVEILTEGIRNITFNKFIQVKGDLFQNKVRLEEE